MSPLEDTLSSARSAVDEMIRTAANCTTTWTTPRAPGKWSPSRVVEHVALSLEAGANDIAGRPTNFPNLPAPVRPIIRALLFNRVLRNGKFPTAKTNKPMNPLTGPATPADAAARLNVAWGSLAAACTDAATRSEELVSKTFGRVRLADYIKFQEHHTRHHQRQMTWS